MALLKVHDYDQAIQNLTRGIVAEYVSRHTLEECLGLTAFADLVKQAVQKEAWGWGINIQRLFIDQITKARAIQLLLPFNGAVGNAGTNYTGCS